MQIVAVDIGGTHARFAIARVGGDGSVALDKPVTLQTRDHASLQTAWERFAEIQDRILPRAVAIAIAGPIGGEVIRFTNNPWIIRPQRICETLHVDRFTLVNDFEAVAHAVASAADDEFLHLHGPERSLPQTGVLSVIGPGTGLGVAQLWRDGSGGYRVQATEGGHIEFAPIDLIDDAILDRLRQRHQRVSVERVVSGPGIVEIYHALATLKGKTVTEADDRILWERGISRCDSLAAAAVDRFCLTLGSVAGDLALAQGAGGVVIAGGLGYRIRETLLASGFSARFAAKGRFESMMSELPVKLIAQAQPGLHGAVRAFIQDQTR